MFFVSAYFVWSTLIKLTIKLQPTALLIKICRYNFIQLFWVAVNEVNLEILHLALSFNIFVYHKIIWRIDRDWWQRGKTIWKHVGLKTIGEFGTEHVALSFFHTETFCQLKNSSWNQVSLTNFVYEGRILLFFRFHNYYWLKLSTITWMFTTQIHSSTQYFWAVFFKMPYFCISTWSWVIIFWIICRRLRHCSFQIWLRVTPGFFRIPKTFHLRVLVFSIGALQVSSLPHLKKNINLSAPNKEFNIMYRLLWYILKKVTFHSESYIALFSKKFVGLRFHILYKANLIDILFHRRHLEELAAAYKKSNSISLRRIPFCNVWIHFCSNVIFPILYHNLFQKE